MTKQRRLFCISQNYGVSISGQIGQSVTHVPSDWLILRPPHANFRVLLAVIHFIWLRILTTVRDLIYVINALSIYRIHAFLAFEFICNWKRKCEFCKVWWKLKECMNIQWLHSSKMIFLFKKWWVFFPKKVSLENLLMILI